MSFKKDFNQLKFALETAIKHDVILDKEIDPQKAMLDYNLNQKKYHQQSLQKALTKLINAPMQLQMIVQDNATGQEKLNKLIELLPSLETKNIEELQKLIKKMELLIKYISFPIC